MKLEIMIVTALVGTLLASVAHAETPKQAPPVVHVELVCGPMHDNAIGGRNADCRVIRTISTPVK